MLLLLQMNVERLVVGPVEELATLDIALVVKESRISEMRKKNFGGIGYIYEKLIVAQIDLINYTKQSQNVTTWST